MMLNKSKSKTSKLAELHFISSLSLAQATMLIGDIADDKHHVLLTEVSADEVQFQIDYVSEDVKLASIEGKLQRWNGYETKIDADGDVNRIASREKARYNKVMRRIFAFTFLSGSFVAVIGQGYLVIPILLSGFAMAANAEDNKQDNPMKTVLFRERDYLLQRLIDTFKDAGEVEAV